MKHLNPRQGITIYTSVVLGRWWGNYECETPKSPPGDYNLLHLPSSADAREPGVKHLNPRQGITIDPHPPRTPASRETRVKHLNPRQGITIRHTSARYDRQRLHGVKHLNPRQGITI